MRSILINQPDYTINLKDLNDPEEIYYFFKDKQISKYAYGFKCHNITVKYGLAGLGYRKIWGERVRGQAAQLSGWLFNKDDLRIGREFNDVLDELGATNKDLFTLEIWDLTNEPEETFTKHLNITATEAELLKQFESQYKRLPIGNKKIEIVHHGVSKETFDSLFE